MRKSLTQNILRASAFALACVALTGANVKAAAVSQTYSTGGTILSTGISNPDGTTATNVISFTPVVSGAFTSPSAVSLGQFQVATLPTGKETDYKDTPFTITYNPLTIAGTNYPTTGAPVTITGLLNGAITGSQSSVVATFSSVSSPVFASADGTYLSTLSVLNNPLALVPASAGGITTVQAQVTTTTPSPASGGGSGDTPPPIPEPTTFAILATAMVGFGIRKRLRSRDAA